MNCVIPSEERSTKDVKSQRILVDKQLAERHVMPWGDVNHVVVALEFNPEFVKQEVEGRDLVGREALRKNGAILDYVIHRVNVLPEKFLDYCIEIVG